MELVREHCIAFGPDEVFSDIFKRPADAALVPRPSVIVGRVAAGEDFRIYGRSASDNPRLSIRDFTVVRVLLRRSLEPPGERPGSHFRKPDRHVDEPVVVVASGFKQKHSGVLDFAEPAGENAACGAAADDHVIVFIRSHHEIQGVRLPNSM